MRQSTRRRPLPSPPLPALSEDELFRRLRQELPEDVTPNGVADLSGHEEGRAAYADALIERLRVRLYRFFRSLADSSRPDGAEPHDLAEDLTQETLIRVAADRDTARRLTGRSSKIDDAPLARDDAPSSGEGPRLDFPRVREDPVTYAFRTAHNVWRSHGRAAAAARRRREVLEHSVEATGGSPWERMLDEETEAEWERRRRCGEQLRAAEVECVAELASTPAPPRAAVRAYVLIAELWLWCSHHRGSAAAYYAAAGIAARNSTRDLNVAERFLRACLARKGLDATVVEALCAYVRRRARGGEG